MTTNNINISNFQPLPSPEEIRLELQLSISAAAQVRAGRRAICNILDGKSDRFMMIVGPCSIHDEQGAMEYAYRLSELSRKVSDKLLLVMRCYFEKPRTSVGWKGLMTDPNLDDSCDVAKGIRLARSIMLKVIDLGLPIATEMLDPMLAQYIADCVSWTAIGARTTEAQTHRQLGSGLSMPVGFKNATDGSLQTAIDAVTSARSCHSFIGLMEDGKVGVFRTKGNKYAHIVLRGGNNHTNYGSEHIAFLKVILEKANLPLNVVVDCSHANSFKDYRLQRKPLMEVIKQLQNGEKTIKAVMLESNLLPGNQKVIPNVKPQSGLSITDGCIGWDETVELIQQTYHSL
jgi:3-deoxy-7-phosphoheptulonate synthase